MMSNDTLRPLYVAEPPAASMIRRPAVVDCSLLASLVFDEPEREQALALIAGRALCAPRLLNDEVVNVAVSKLRRGLALDDARLALSKFAELAIEFAEPDGLSQFDLAARYALSACDAAYLWLAGELRAPLLTFDKKLADAARQHLQSLG